MAKDMRTQPTSPNSIPASRPAVFKNKKLSGGGGGGRLSAAAGSPFWGKNPAGRDVEMEFGDVGCVRISLAINSNPFPT